jgi:hypothetical protein
VSGQFHAPGKEPRYPLDRRLGGPQSRSDRGGEDKKDRFTLHASLSVSAYSSPTKLKTGSPGISSLQCHIYSFATTLRPALRPSQLTVIKVGGHQQPKGNVHHLPSPSANVNS